MTIRILKTLPYMQTEAGFGEKPKMLDRLTSLSLQNTASEVTRLYILQKVKLPTNLSAMILKASAERGSASAGRRVIAVAASSTSVPCSQHTGFEMSNPHLLPRLLYMEDTFVCSFRHSAN